MILDATFLRIFGQLFLCDSFIHQYNTSIFEQTLSISVISILPTQVERYPQPFTMICPLFLRRYFLLSWHLSHFPFPSVSTPLLPSLYSSFFKLSLSHHSSVFLPNNFPILFKYLSFFHFSYIFLAILSLPFFHEIFFRGPISISLSFAFISMTFFPPFS